MNCSLPQQSGIFYCPKISNLPLLIEYDEVGAVTHLGISLFSETLKEAVGKPVCEFQERLFLELFLQDSEKKARKLLDEYKIQITTPYFGSFFNELENSIIFAKQASNYGFTKDSLTWISTWSDSEGVFSLRFLSNYDLILGMDKNEAEIWLATQLENFKCNAAISQPLIESGELEQLTRSLFVKRGKNLFTQGMNSNLYFSPDTATCTFGLIFDSKFPIESVTNLFNHPNQQAEGLDLQIRQLNYGGKFPSYKIKLSDFQCFMGNDFETFSGIEKCTADTIEFTVMYKSLWYNCTHLLHVKTTLQQLFYKAEPLNATLTTFIPNHNIKDLYKGETRETSELPTATALYKFACDSSESAARTSELTNDAAHLETLSSEVRLPIIKIKKNEYFFEGTNKTMNNKELFAYFKEYCPETYKTFEKGYQLTQNGSSCFIIGSVFATGGFVGMVCTLKTNMFPVSTAFMVGGALCMIVGDIVINKGKGNINCAIDEYNSRCATKNQTTLSLNLGITQSGGVGFNLKF